jgi:hypothetical protein
VGFLVQLVDFSPVGFGPVVFWSSCRLVKLSFCRVGFGRVVGGRVVGGRVVGGRVVGGRVDRYMKTQTNCNGDFKRLSIMKLFVSLYTAYGNLSELLFK